MPGFAAPLSHCWLAVIVAVGCLVTATPSSSLSFHLSSAATGCTAYADAAGRSYALCFQPGGGGGTLDRLSASEDAARLRLGSFAEAADQLRLSGGDPCCADGLAACSRGASVKRWPRWPRCANTHRPRLSLRRALCGEIRRPHAALR
jgi:hypothetical protein